jgi:hypothetical protein
MQGAGRSDAFLQACEKSYRAERLENLNFLKEQ